MPTVNDTVKENLCTGCATCISLCPTNAIELIKNEFQGVYLPNIINNICIDCGTCKKVCPGLSVDFIQLNLDIFNKIPEDNYIGNYIECYAGHCKDFNIRHNSSSGGLITQILIYALKSGIIDGALVTRMKKDKPLEPEPFIARTIQDIIEASKSKYCPVPANLALKQILDSPNGEKYAVVGLPCHIQGIRKAEIANKKLMEKIVLHLGLFCNHAPTFLATEYLLKKLKINYGSIKKLDYRGEGWPGKTKIQYGNQELLLPFSWKYVGSYYFTPFRCFLCSDGLNELADLSFGDAWIPKFSADTIGNSVIISRNTFCNNILWEMQTKELIDIEVMKSEELIPHFKRMLDFKKVGISARMKILNKYILYDNIFKANNLDYLVAFFPYINLKLYNNISFRKFLLRYLPLKSLWLFSLPYLAMYSLRNRYHAIEKPLFKNKKIKKKNL